ncbi:hypothetical protein [Streptomyces sp. NPDC053720]|uniref:hypothetical protein n=1 Tax=Streptomyces sp. NPDC053720 TaxID=3154855 RepID=UPI003434FB9E
MAESGEQAADPAVATVTMLNTAHQALGRDRWAPRVLAAERRRPCTEQAAARFHTVQRALRQALPRMREEVSDIAAQARPPMPARWRPNWGGRVILSFFVFRLEWCLEVSRSPGVGGRGEGEPLAPNAGET